MVHVLLSTPLILEYSQVLIRLVSQCNYNPCRTIRLGKITSFQHFANSTSPCSHLEIFQHNSVHNIFQICLANVLGPTNISCPMLVMASGTWKSIFWTDRQSCKSNNKICLSLRDQWGIQKSEISVRFTKSRI